MRLVCSNVDPKEGYFDERRTGDTYHTQLLRFMPERSCNFPVHVMRCILFVACSISHRNPYVFPCFITWVLESYGMDIPEEMRTTVEEKDILTKDFLKKKLLFSYNHLTQVWSPTPRLGNFYRILVDTRSNYDVSFDAPIPPPPMLDFTLEWGQGQAAPEEGEQAEGVGETKTVTPVVRRKPRGHTAPAPKKKSAFGAIAQFLNKMKHTFSCFPQHQDEKFQKIHRNTLRLCDPEASLADLEPYGQFHMPDDFEDIPMSF